MNQMKVFFSIDKQIEILKNRGLIINDNVLEDAKQFLLKNNYYRIKGYYLTLFKGDRFLPNISIDDIKDIYYMDRELRSIILHIVEGIEVHLKTLIAYFHSEKFTGNGYLDKSNFNPNHRHFEKNYESVMKSFENQKNRNYMTELFVRHHKDNKNNEYPTWVFIELLNLSDTSKLYSILEIDLKLKIALEFKLKGTKAHDILGNLLHCITILRNICAHGGRLYNRMFIMKPKLSSEQKQLLLKDDQGVIQNNKLFSYVIVIKALINDNEYQILKNKLIEMQKKYPLANFKEYGFPENWMEVL